VERLKRELFAQDRPTNHPYFRDLRRHMQGAAVPVPLAAVQAACARADIVYVGDFHADPPCQLLAADLIDGLLRRGRRAILGIEFVYTRQQGILDRRQEGRLTDPAFLRRVHYREDWGYPWEGLRTLLDRARALGVAVHALDRPPRGGVPALTRRDDHAARRIAELRKFDPEATIVVLFGESHLSRGHIPKRVCARLAPLGLAPRSVHVFQDPDDLYWRLVEERGAPPEAVSLGDDTFAVFHTSPLAKYEAYRQVLERWRGDVPTEEEVDLTPAVHHLLGTLQGWLGIGRRRVTIRHRGGWVEDLEDCYPEVYSGSESAALLVPIMVEHGRGEEEIEDSRALFAERGALYDARANVLFLERYKPGRAAGEGARFLRTALSGRLFEAPPSGGDPVERAYGAAYNEAVVYLGARLVDPASDVVTRSEMDALAASAREDSDATVRDRMAWLESHRRFEATTRLTLPGELAEPLHRSRTLRRSLARDLGHRLGRVLFDLVESGRISRRGLRTVFSRSLEAPAARLAVLRWLRRPAR
jgi:hypothetical protein